MAVGLDELYVRCLTEPDPGRTPRKGISLYFPLSLKFYLKGYGLLFSWPQLSLLLSTDSGFLRSFREWIKACSCNYFLERELETGPQTLEATYILSIMLGCLLPQ